MYQLAELSMCHMQFIIYLQCCLIRREGDNHKNEEQSETQKR